MAGDDKPPALSVDQALDRALHEILGTTESSGEEGRRKALVRTMAALVLAVRAGAQRSAALEARSERVEDLLMQLPSQVAQSMNGNKAVASECRDALTRLADARDHELRLAADATALEAKRLELAEAQEARWTSRLSAFLTPLWQAWPKIALALVGLLMAALGYLTSLLNGV